MCRDKKYQTIYATIFIEKRIRLKIFLKIKFKRMKKENEVKKSFICQNSFHFLQFNFTKVTMVTNFEEMTQQFLYETFSDYKIFGVVF